MRFTGKSFPKDPRFESSYIFKHDATGKEFFYIGNDMYVQLPELGRYTIKYNYDIESACKDTVIGRVYVNSISGSIQLDTQSACSPMVVNPRFNIDYNEINGFTDTSLKYNWEIVPKAGAVIYGASTPNPRVEINQDHTYRIVLYVSNSSGCGFYTRSTPIRTGIKAAFNQSSTKSCVGDTSYSNVAYVSGAGVYNIPNSFTPNNDGLNEVFNFYTLFMTGETINDVPDFEIEIYSRWWQLIHYGTDINKPWDGTAKGEIQPPGVYKYRIKFTDGNENRKYIGGTIHLIR